MYLDVIPIFSNAAFIIASILEGAFGSIVQIITLFHRGSRTAENLYEYYHHHFRILLCETHKFHIQIIFGIRRSINHNALYGRLQNNK
jgi:hypothetical protein